MNIEAMKIVRDNLKMGHVLSFAEMMIIQQAIDAAMLQGKAEQGCKVPDGWVMVPVEPTEDMCNVSHIGVDVYTGLARDDEYYSIGGVCAAKVYRAMLAAAPQPENESE
ncbi:TPA: hypothetical protein ACN787_002755 [Citrobacter freundii]